MQDVLFNGQYPGFYHIGVLIFSTPSKNRYFRATFLIINALCIRTPQQLHEKNKLYSYFCLSQGWIK